MVTPREPSSKPRRTFDEINSSHILVSSSTSIDTRTVRDSTKVKSQDAEVSRNKAMEVRAAVIRNLPQIKHQFTQKELLQEAIQTEVYIYVYICILTDAENI